MSHPRHQRVRSLGMIGLLVVLTGCAVQGEEPDPPDAAVADAPVEDAAGGAPEECATAFPQAFTAPDLAEVEALPTNWPDPPDDSILCLTASGLGDAATESISYATEADQGVILAHYEQALADYRLERLPSPTGGEMLAGEGQTVGFQVQPGDGSFVIVIRPAG
ncbi:hypothetical protein ACYX8G_17480 [Microbacterium saperdae]